LPSHPALHFSFRLDLWRKRPSTEWHFLKTLEHEATHIFIGLLFLKMRIGLRVTAFDGGRARYAGYGSTGETWIALGPYFFPTFPLIIMLIALLVGMEGMTFLLVLGLGTAFHISSTWEQTHARQSDISDVGVLRSILILPLMNLLSVGVIVSYVLNGFPFVALFLSTVGISAYRF
jgi:hypothetical protein